MSEHSLIIFVALIIGLIAISIILDIFTPPKTTVVKPSKNDLYMPIKSSSKNNTRLNRKPRDYKIFNDLSSDDLDELSPSSVSRRARSMETIDYNAPSIASSASYSSSSSSCSSSSSSYSSCSSDGGGGF